jgi:uncharacterized RDD family membrane protein YckC
MDDAMTSEAGASPGGAMPVPPAPRRREPLGHPGPTWAGDGALGAPPAAVRGEWHELTDADASAVAGGRTLGALPARVAAFVIDELLMSFVVGVVTAIAGVEVVVAPGADFTTALAETQRQMQPFLPLIYATQVLFRWPWNAIGWSPGKRLLGLRVVNAQGDAPGLLRGFVRSLFALASDLPLFIGYVWALFDGERRAWHDHLARTWVVRAREDADRR